jgi:hypothetical protein
MTATVWRLTDACLFGCGVKGRCAAGGVPGEGRGGCGGEGSVWHDPTALGGCGRQARGGDDDEVLL